jgi:hypothetical protein
LSSINRVAFEQTNGFSHRDPKVAQVIAAEILIEGKCRRIYPAGRVGELYHVEISLELAVFTRGAVDGDIGKIKFYPLAIVEE